MSVIECLSAKEALKKLETTHPDIILTDLWMPEMDGEELAKTIRINPNTSHIPIVAITADTQIQNPDKIYDGILFKPITMSAVSAAINDAMNGRKGN